MTNLLLDFSEQTVDAELLDGELSRTEAAQILNVSGKTLYNYLTWLSAFVPHIEGKFTDQFGGLNKQKLSRSDVDFLKKIIALRQKFTKQRCEQILTHYFGEN